VKADRTPATRMRSCGTAANGDGVLHRKRASATCDEMITKSSLTLTPWAEAAEPTGLRTLREGCEPGPAALKTPATNQNGSIPISQAKERGSAAVSSSDDGEPLVCIVTGSPDSPAGSETTGQLGRRPSAPLGMVDCLAATRSWQQRGRPRSGARERSVIAPGIRSQGASGEARA
jgi:hypothetical protein